MRISSHFNYVSSAPLASDTVTKQQQQQHEQCLFLSVSIQSVGGRMYFFSFVTLYLIFVTFDLNFSICARFTYRSTVRIYSLSFIIVFVFDQV